MNGRCRQGWERGNWLRGVHFQAFPPPPHPSSLAHSLHHCVPAGREVIFVAIDKRNPEVEEQVDEKGSRILCQKDLGGWAQVSHPMWLMGEGAVGMGQGSPSPS